MQPWKTLERRTVLDFNRFLRVEQHRVELPDGRVIDDWPWLVTPDYINVLARTTEGAFVCFRQTKYAVDGIALAPVGGYIEKGEEPLEAARRELMEEAGCEAREWVALGSYAVDSNRGNGTAWFFLALDATLVQAPTADDLEEQELVLLERAELERAIDAGEIKSLGWVASFLLALRHLDARSAAVRASP
jgi:ADP-ribose pyrophosphatase